MKDLLVPYDVQAVLEKSRSALKKVGIYPEDCPLLKCLSINRVTLQGDQTIVQIDANPPELPTTKSWLKYENHPVCRDKCGIIGNSNREFVVEQQNRSGEITKVEARWKRDHI